MSPEVHWCPVVDGVSLKDSPLRLIKSGRYNNQVPVMLGSNSDEEAFYLMPSLLPPHMSERSFDRMMLREFGYAEGHYLKKLYDPSRYEYPSDLGPFSRYWWTAMRIATDRVPGLGHCGSRTVARSFVAHGTPGVFVYIFEHPTTPGGGDAVFASHGSEIKFVYDREVDLVKGSEIELAEKMSSYWSTFATNQQSLQLQWPLFDNDTIISFKTASEGAITIKTGFRNAQCDYWDFKNDIVHSQNSKV
jgi:carboxylesterase type B